MILGGLAESSSFSAAEIDGFDAAEAVFWWNSIMAYRRSIIEKDG